MTHIILEQEELSLVSLDEAKTQCNIMLDNSIDDDNLKHLIAVCSDLAQTYCNRLLTRGNVGQLFEAYASSFTVWGGGVEKITSITATDIEGNEIEITDFTFNFISQKLKISSEYAQCEDFTVVYSAGYDVLPVKVKHGVLLMISTMFLNREDYITGLTVANMPLTSLKLLDSVRHYYAT